MFNVKNSTFNFSEPSVVGVVQINTINNRTYFYSVAYFPISRYYMLDGIVAVWHKKSDREKRLKIKAI